MIAIDPFYFGECRIETRTHLYALIEHARSDQYRETTSSVQVHESLPPGTATPRWVGPRTSLIALVAAGVETGAIRELKMHQPMSTLKEPIQQDMEVNAAPELFCFGLAEQFNMQKLKSLVAPRMVSVD